MKRWAITTKEYIYIVFAPNKVAAREEVTHYGVYNTAITDVYKIPKGRKVFRFENNRLT
jgi:hypothetical protein